MPDQEFEPLPPSQKMPKEFQDYMDMLCAPMRRDRPFKIAPDGLTDHEVAQWRMAEDTKWEAEEKIWREAETKRRLTVGLPFKSNYEQDIADEIAFKESKRLKLEEERQERSRVYREEQQEKSRIFMEQKTAEREARREENRRLHREEQERLQAQRKGLTKAERAAELRQQLKELEDADD